VSRQASFEFNTTPAEPPTAGHSVSKPLGTESHRGQGDALVGVAAAAEWFGRLHGGGLLMRRAKRIAGSADVSQIPAAVLEQIDAFARLIRDGHPRAVLEGGATESDVARARVEAERLSDAVAAQLRAEYLARQRR
jgi:hypothetical protein